LGPSSPKCPCCGSPNTADSYGDALKPLTSFFGDKPINEIGSVHLRMYQGLRSAKVCANTINREVGVLQQVLRAFDEWKRFENHYRQLKEPPRRAGRSLTREEEQRLREVALSKPEWLLAGHCMMVMWFVRRGGSRSWPALASGRRHKKSPSPKTRAFPRKVLRGS
jgi:hypothetical protein